MSTFGFSEPAVSGGDIAKRGWVAGRVWQIVGIVMLVAGVALAVLGAG